MWRRSAKSRSTPRPASCARISFWLALDPGIVLNPDSVLAQTEGNVIFGLSQTLKEQVSISDGQVQQNNFYDYPVLRMSEMPEIDIQIMPTDNPAKGYG